VAGALGALLGLLLSTQAAFVTRREWTMYLAGEAKAATVTAASLERIEYRQTALANSLADLRAELAAARAAARH